MIRVAIATPVVEGAPGELVDVTLIVGNDGSTPTTCRARVVGLAPTDGRPRAGAPFDVPPGRTIEHVVTVAVPAALGVGDHAAAIEVDPDRPGDRPALVPFTLAIASVALVELTPVPATVRGRRRASFRLDVVNQEPGAVDLALSGEAPDVRVRFRPERVRLEPGGAGRATARLRGPRRWSGEPTQHNILVTASGRAAATTTTVAYVQRPLFAHRARMLVAALTVIALWLGAIGGFALWWSGRGDDEQATSGRDVGELVGRDTDGDGVPDTFIGPDGAVIHGEDTDGDGVPDAFFDADGNPVPDPTGAGAGGGGAGGGGTGGDGTGGDGTGGSVGDGTGEGTGGSTRPISSVVRGTVVADGDPADVAITLAPIALGAATDQGIHGFAGAGRPVAIKYWSARRGTASDGTLNPVRQTEPIAPLQTSPEADGVWLFTDVALGQSYQIVFTKPGFDTQSFVVTPPDDGSPVHLDVELHPAEGAISGVVRGPTGPLGGATITVSDGTLTFTTTSATVGDVGSWSVTEVSTPGVYTVSAELHGYGTEVRQVRLGPGERFAGADLTMRRGVGSISGRIVGHDGLPLGGATVTATVGEVTTTTSSLTEGDIGAYTLPQLAIPGTYTVRVEHPGYLTQTRRLPLGGAVGGVDFAMTRTQLRLTGTVRSDATGAGVPSAGLILSTGDLTFRAATAVAPNQGSFALDDLPPGNYTVTVEHYEHETATQFLTLTAGVAPPPLDILLERTSGPPELGRGTLVVEVIDPNAENADQREIENATVRLVNTVTGTALPPVTQEAFNFRITDIPIGTYTLLVTAPRYNPAPPRQVSIGLSEQRVEVALLRLGQASGRVVDSLTGEVLTGYFVSLFRQPERAGDAPVFTLAARADGTWQTQPDTLIPGTYRIEISDAASPLGYVVRDDQLLDPDVVGDTPASRFMRFVLPPTSVDPVVVADIEADRYPTVTGRVYRPRLDGADIEIVPVDRSDLKVSLACPGGTTASATVSDDAGVRDADPPLFDSFTITPEQIDTGDLTGDCTVRVQAGGMDPRTVSLAGIDANNGITASDRRIHVVLTPPAPEIGGTVYWIDGTTRMPVAAVDITATRVTRFDPLESATANQPPVGTPTPGATTSGTDGSWDLPGQVAGVATYHFDADHFAPGTIVVTVDEPGVATAVAGVATAVTTTPQRRFDVRLSAPDPRTLAGELTILTTATPAFGDVAITATSPTGQAVVEGPPASPTAPAIVRGTAVGGTLPFTIVNAQPGTWSVDVSEPDGHDYFGTPPPVTRLVPPGSGTAVGFDATLVELGSLTLTLRDVDGAPITTPPEVILTGATTITAELAPTPDPDDGPNVFLLGDIPVHPTDPVGTDATYSLAVSVDGYDTTDATAIPIAVRAGETIPVPLTLPTYGTLTGEAVGVIDAAGTTEPLPFTAGGGVLTVTRVDVDGTPLPTDTPGYRAPTVSTSDNSFTVSGPEGYYRIEITHPQFTAATPPTDTFDPSLTLPPDLPPSPVPGVFRIVNDAPNEPGEFALDIIRGALDLSVFKSLTQPTPTSPAPIDGEASWELFQNGLPVRSGTTVAGAVLVADLYPGDYRLEVRQFDATGTIEIAFPVITGIRIERAVAGTGSTTTVRAPLPPLRSSMVGTIVARNSDGEPVPLPGDVTYAVTSTYAEPAIEIDGASTVPDPAQGDATATVDATAAASGTVEYTFASVPVGQHQVTLAESTLTALVGYSLVGDATRAVAVVESGIVAGPEFVLVVPDVTVRVQLTAGFYPDITTLALTAPSGTRYGFAGPDTFEGTVVFDDATDVVTFTGVAPEIGPFEFDLVDALHAPVDGSQFAIPPDTDGDADPSVAVSVATTATLGRVAGAASQRDTATVTSDLGAGATITLANATDTYSLTVAAGEAIAEHFFDAAPGAYTLTTTRPGYTTHTRSVTVVAGQLVGGIDVQVDKLATLTVTIDNGSTLTSPSIRLRTGGGDLVSATSSGSTPSGQPQATFTVPAATYTIVVSASNYRETALSPTVPLAIGASTTRAVNLPRLLAVSVSGPATANVLVYSSPTATTPILTSGLKASPIEFSSATVPGLPTSGDLTLQVEADGYRTQRVTAAYGLDRSVSVVLLPDVTVTGVITDAGGTTLTGNKVATTTGITATSGDATLVGSVDTTGAYRIAGLTVGANGADRVWTLVYDKQGTGTSSGTDTVTITGATPAALGGPSLAIVPKPVMLVFTVTSSAGGAVADASVTVGALPAVPTGADGTIEISVDENATDLAWSVAKEGFETETGTIDEFANRNDYPIPVTLAVVPPPPAPTVPPEPDPAPPTDP